MMFISYRRPDVSSLVPEELSEAEANWVHFQPFLVSKGYQLRPRYRPGWQPSWRLSGANPYDCEDSCNALPIRTLDAIRIADGLQVIIKMIIPSDDNREGEEELDILKYLSSEECITDPANHAVQCLDSFSIPGVEKGAFCVMPLLTAYNYPAFHSLGEIHDLLKQIFKGLQFLHAHNIAHWRGCLRVPGGRQFDRSFHRTRGWMRPNNLIPLRKETPLNQLGGPSLVLRGAAPLFSRGFTP
ncbi:hypothetical protein ACGC1H_001074 [Rhizoctonia solani]